MLKKSDVLEKRKQPLEEDVTRCCGTPTQLGRGVLSERLTPTPRSLPIAFSKPSWLCRMQEMEVQE